MLVLFAGIYQGFSQFNRKVPVSKTIKVPPGVKMPKANKRARFMPMLPSVRNINDIPVWRLQLRVHTANRDKAGTDSKVYIKLTENNQEFWLLQGGNDRKRNEWEVYDIVMTERGTGKGLISTIRDITQLTLGIKGDDAWEFDRLELLVNNPYDRKTTNQGGSAYIIYSYGASQKIARNKKGFNSMFSISGRTLRSHYKWRYKEHLMNLPWVTTHGEINIGFQREVLEEIIEGSLGHEMGPGGMLAGRKWGDKRGRTHVGIKHKENFDRGVARLDVDIHPSRAIDVEVKFKVSCDGRNIKAEVIGTNIRTNPMARAFTTTLAGSLEFGLGKILSKSMRDMFVESNTCLPPQFSDDHHLFFFPIYEL